MKVQEMTCEKFLNSRILWDDLLKRSIDNNVFLTWEWLSAWWKHYGAGKRLLLVIVTEDDKPGWPLLHWCILVIACMVSGYPK